jgi:UDPglucose 6-dehydrogenase/GDP-mannose 6-dehydrogenase
MKVVIIGTGYVGLVSGVGLADIGHEVVCVDVDPKKVELINSAISPIHESGLDELLRKSVSSGALTATIDLRKAIIGAEVSMIAVGTPFDGNEIDLQFIRQAAKDIASTLPLAAAYHVVCVKSTVVPGTTENVVGKILEENSSRKLGVDLGLCMNPEFLAEGTAVADFMNPDRIVIGAIDSASSNVMKKLYEPFTFSDFVFTTPATAEVCKYAANAFLATVISYANEIANLCSEIEGVDVVDVLNAVYKDRRLSPITPHGRITPGLLSFLFPGTGFGGSCFPKDVKALASYGSALNRPMKILQAVLETNRLQPGVTVDLLRQALGNLKGKRVSVLGLAFKPGTDDVRETPSFSIIQLLLKEQASVVAHDPIAIDSMKSNYPGLQVEYRSDVQDAVADADAVIFATRWPEYSSIYQYLNSRSVPVIDGRRFLDKQGNPLYAGVGLSMKKARDTPF